MGDATLTKEQLIRKLEELRLRVAELESSEGQGDPTVDREVSPRLPWPKVEHELRNLLAIMASHVDLLERSAADQTARRQLELLSTAIRSGATLLDRASGGPEY